jgi:hypothetical protein
MLFEYCVVQRHETETVVALARACQSSLGGGGMVVGKNNSAVVLDCASFGIADVASECRIEKVKRGGIVSQDEVDSRALTQTLRSWIAVSRLSGLDKVFPRRFTPSEAEGCPASSAKRLRVVGIVAYRLFRVR